MKTSYCSQKIWLLVVLCQATGFWGQPLHPLPIPILVDKLGHQIAISLCFLRNPQATYAVFEEVKYNKVSISSLYNSLLLKG